MQNILPLYQQIREECDFDLLFIDDSSPDGTADAIIGLMDSDPGVLLLRRDRKEGLGQAYRAAFREVLRMGRWKRVFMMDADLSHQPSHLPLLDRSLDSSRFVLGSRYITGVSVLNWSILRLNLSWSANRYIRFVTGLPYSDCTSGFRGFHADMIPVLLSSGIRASGYAFLVETLYGVWKEGIEVKEVPIVFVERKMGASKVSFGVFIESLLTPVRLFMRSVLGG